MKEQPAIDCWDDIALMEAPMDIINQLPIRFLYGPFLVYLSI